MQPIHEEDIMANTENCPKVGIVMGSDSDMPVMAKAADILEELGIPYEMTVISAHREPDVFFEYAKSAEEKGFKVIIAGAGMAAHLPGMCAAIFPMPVIGIPMHTTSLGGRDSLYSIVQMPSGIPVATVAINGGANAGLLAAKILATSDAELLGKLKAYSTKLKEQVEANERNTVCKDRIPQVFLILQDGVPAGTFQFAMSDIDTRPDCYPWLRDFWIQPAFRGKGLTYTVMEAVKDHAARLHLTELYLFTRHEGLYEKFGWEYIETFPTYLTPEDKQRLYRLSICKN